MAWMLTLETHIYRRRLWTCPFGQVSLASEFRAVERPRVKSDKRPALPLTTTPSATPARAVVTNTGPLATAAWCLARGLYPTERNWFVEVSLRAIAGSCFDIEIYAEEWGFQFRHDTRVSWIRVTDIPFVHGRDEFDLLREVSGLKDITRVLRAIETRYRVTFPREDATVRTNIDDAESTIREWIESL